jgi:hypothetical protein
MSLCGWLEKRLEKPVRARITGKNHRRVTVFEGLSYAINSDQRYIEADQVINGAYEPCGVAFEIGRPLRTRNWILYILENLDLANASQRDLFFNATMIDDFAQWITDTAYRSLLRDPRFQELRRALPRLFKIPRDIYSIALAARPRPVGPLLNSRTVNIVWRNEQAFRQVARENPHLLPLLLSYIDRYPANRPVNIMDPVKLIKHGLRESGLSEATWRYLSRHGSRLFRIPWEVTDGQGLFEVAIRFLEALQSAGLPPPPPPSVVKAFLHGYNAHCGNNARIGKHFHARVNPVALRAGLLEADRRRQAGAVEGFAEEFLGVCWWSEWASNLLDENQTKAGWQWFVHRWREEEDTKVLIEIYKPAQWLTRVGRFQMGQLVVVPLQSSEALIRESLAMRNCLHACIDDCESGDLEIYSVRDIGTGKRKGCIGFQFEADGSPSIADMKGFANTPPRGEVRQAAVELILRLQTAAATMKTLRS